MEETDREAQKQLTKQGLSTATSSNYKLPSKQKKRPDEARFHHYVEDFIDSIFALEFNRSGVQFLHSRMASPDRIKIYRVKETEYLLDEESAIPDCDTPGDSENPSTSIEFAPEPTQRVFLSSSGIQASNHNKPFMLDTIPQATDPPALSAAALEPQSYDGKGNTLKNSTKGDFINRLKSSLLKITNSQFTSDDRSNKMIDRGQTSRNTLRGSQTILGLKANIEQAAKQQATRVQQLGGTSSQRSLLNTDTERRRSNSKSATSSRRGSSSSNTKLHSLIRHKLEDIKQPMKKQTLQQLAQRDRDYLPTGQFSNLLRGKVTSPKGSGLLATAAQEIGAKIPRSPHSGAYRSNQVQDLRRPPELVCGHMQYPPTSRPGWYMYPQYVPCNYHGSQPMYHQERCWECERQLSGYPNWAGVDLPSTHRTPQGMTPINLDQFKVKPITGVHGFQQPKLKALSRQQSPKFGSSSNASINISLQANLVSYPEKDRPSTKSHQIPGMTTRKVQTQQVSPSRAKGTLSRPSSPSKADPPTVKQSRDLAANSPSSLATQTGKAHPPDCSP